MAFITVSAGQPIRATHVNQFSSWITGTKLDTVGVIAATSASEYALTVFSQETSSGLAMAIKYGASIASATTIATFNATGATFNALTLNSVTVSGPATFVSAVAMQQSLNVAGSATIGTTLTATGVATFVTRATIGGTLTVTGVGTFVTGVTVGGTLGVTGAATVSGPATFVTNVSMQQGLNLTGNATVGGTMIVTGVTTFVTTASVGGAFSVTGATTLRASATVTGSVAASTFMAAGATVAGTGAFRGPNNDAVVFRTVGGGSMPLIGNDTSDNMFVGDLTTVSVLRTRAANGMYFTCPNGHFEFGGGALATTATVGFPCFPTMTAPPTGGASPTAGLAPFVVDTGSGRLYIRYGGAWHYAALT